MIFRLSQKLNARIKAGTLAALPLDDNPFADWSAGLFLAGRSPYILLSNTKSLYSTVLLGKGITNASAFIESVLRIRECLQTDGHEGVYERHIAPASAEVRFARALNRSVTGSMNELIRFAGAWLAEGDLGILHEVSVRLNDTLLSALARSPSLPYGKPREAFRELSAPPASRPRSEGDDAGG